MTHTATTRHKSLATRTIALLRTIATAILSNPSSYDQNNFVAEFQSEAERGCVAFHHAKLTRTARQLANLVKKHRDWDINPGTRMEVNPFYLAAKKDLKLTSGQAERLVGAPSDWPFKYCDAYRNAKTPKGRARALANRVEFFIQTDGTDLTARERKAAEKTHAAELARERAA